ncbi:MAG: hypothetical protein HY843_03225, partial [Bdellovibrio sp.]|nr:hypothetical protein [Bdellovibrio sp.]
MISIYNNIKQLLFTSCLSFILISCTNNSGFFINKKPTAASPTPSPSTVEKNIFTITKVIKSNVEPNSLVDILSELTGEIGQICSQIVQTDNNQTQNIATCVCQFTYTKRDGWVETWSTQPSYLESNLIRCPYQGVPLDSANISVRIVNQATGGKSNELAFPLYGRQTALDSNHPLNYVQVRRYQCKDAIFIPNVFDGSIYDPFLSEDKYLTYPVNFFTTNMGGTLTQFVEKIKPTQGAGFICPSDTSQLLVPQIFSFGTNQSPKLGLKMSPLDIQDEFDRQTFYLAKEKFGVFQIAFNTFIAPGLVSSEAKPVQNSSSSKKTQPPPPLGFAAQPYRYQNGEESCPADSFLPKGFRWVKVWQWRASLPARA